MIPPGLNPYSLPNQEDYSIWRDQKLKDYLTTPDIFVEISHPPYLSAAERTQIISLCQRYNLALFTCRHHSTLDKAFVHQLGQQLGLYRLDGNLCADEDNISAIQVSQTTDPLQPKQDYIPYSNKALSWHTDGYYNTPDKTIRGMILYCVRPAAQGGSNTLLDHEMAYILLREENPDYIAELMQPTVLTIPANTIHATEIRPAQTGPVFSMAPDQPLHMRYTARRHHIQWRDHPLTHQATQALTAILNQNPYLFKITLQAGQGLICNNILHNRAAFTDDLQQPRLLYRARYYDAVSTLYTH